MLFCKERAVQIENKVQIPYRQNSNQVNLHSHYNCESKIPVAMYPPGEVHIAQSQYLL